eukprot:1083040_1
MQRLRQQRVHPPPSFTTMQQGLPPASSSSPNSSQRRIHQMLSNYILNIRKGDIIPRLNLALQSRSPSKDTAADIQSYYASRPELRNYTLGVELDRDLDYTLILEDGQ